jgi:hypothetical protein
MFKWFRVGWLLVALLLMPNPALATSPCQPQTVAQALESATAVVYGRLYKVETTEALVHTIVAEKVYKGEPPTPISARYPLQVAKSPFTEGKSYTFYLNKDEKGNWQISPCATHHEGPPTAEEAALFGEGRAPAPPDTSKLWIPIVAMSVAVGGVGLVLLRNRLGRRPR